MWCLRSTATSWPPASVTPTITNCPARSAGVMAATTFAAHRCAGGMAPAVVAVLVPAEGAGEALGDPCSGAWLVVCF
jgi:hypothetical protein